MDTDMNTELWIFRIGSGTIIELCTHRELTDTYDLSSPNLAIPVPVIMKAM